MVVRAEFNFLSHRVPPSSRPLPPHAIKEEGGEKVPVCMSCIWVLVGHAWLFCTSLLAFHGLKLIHVSTPTARNAGKCSLAAEGKKSDLDISTCHFLKTVHSGPTTLGS